jgi:GTP-binding protein HflX
VEAFRATLEEVQQADLLLHIRDISHLDTEAQKQDVDQVLKNLGVSQDSELTSSTPIPLIEVLNKSDLLSSEKRDVQVLRAQNNKSKMALVSALTGDGFTELLRAIDDQLTARRIEVKLKVSWQDGALLTWLYDRGEVIERKDKEKWVELKIRLEPEDIARFDQKKSKL